MSCRYVDLSRIPYDEATIDRRYDEEGCLGIGAHFAGNPIAGGDCIVFGGQAYHVVGVKVLCDEAEVFTNGTPGGGSPTKTHTYTGAPVVIQFWLAPMPSEELPHCTGYP